ncbi:hypothetical protein EJ08DRAFT_227833 [Tothia fuscella]|uniref:Uncharacterized protein n=1 Tax=Tothia fuscella TaxID=1048955 RepID=A0A9P4P3U4_9PEZI|nr:hypothetical protein EJ08DRAFT_227833 [Tothia fuscella]
MELDANWSKAELLVQTYPFKAVELIASTCSYEEITKSITIGRHGHRASDSFTAVSAENEYSALRPPFNSPPNSQQSGSPPVNSRDFRRPPTRAPPSPAPTASTSKSSTAPEYVVIICDGQAGSTIRECRLSMRTGLTELSTIRTDIVRDRLGECVSIEPIPTGPVSIHYPGAHGAMLSHYQARLTWRRSNSHRTHETTFFMVSNDFDSDILLGDVDSGARRAEMQFPHPKRAEANFVAMSARPPAPSPPIHDSYQQPSYHASSFYGSHTQSSHTPTQFSHNGFHPNHAPMGDLSGQMGSQYQQPRFSPIPESRPSSSGRSQIRTQASAGTSSPLRYPPNQSPVQELLVEYTWDTAHTIVKLDINAGAEIFFTILDSKFATYLRRTLDRSKHFIRFTAKKDSGEIGHSLCLDESMIECAWDPALDWMKDNKRAKPPHLYAMIELEPE